MTAVSVYYYYTIVKAMFLTEARTEPPIQPTRVQWVVAAAAFILTIGIGILPQFFINRSVEAAQRFPVYQSAPVPPTAEPSTAPQTGQLK